MLVESVTKKSALDMTWIEFHAILDGLPIFDAIRSGKGLNHAQIVALQKKAKEQYADG
jgi:hypothetical protein